LVLDRDGVINVDVPGRYVCSADEWIPIDGALEAMARLDAAGFDLYVVSNQSGIGRGLFGDSDLAAIHEKCVSELGQYGGTLAGWFYCPHTPDDDCQCRKPRTGMLDAVAEAAGCKLDGFAFVGDKHTDLLAAQTMEMRGILVGTGHGRVTLEAYNSEVNEYFEDLPAVSTALIEGAARQ
jgi:D-glycero-D-manno-heptose 1,7-bisphosphate phosphatase